MEYINVLTLAQAATDYRRRGWWPIPLDGKCPITAWTTAPILNEPEINLLWPDTPPGANHLNIGIRMGRCSGLVALDIDGLGGAAWLHDRTTLDEQEQLGQTIQFTTPNGHRLLYAYPDTIIESRSFRDPQNRRLELVRILSDGTQTVAPPSEIQGAPYLWTNHAYPLAPWPIHIIGKLHDTATNVIHQPTHIIPALTGTTVERRAAAWLRKCDPAICGQGAHDHTFKLAIRLTRGFGLSYHVALQMLTDIWNPTCRRPWGDIELAHKVETALNSTSPTRNML